MATFEIREAKKDELPLIKKLSAGQLDSELDERELREKGRIEEEAMRRLEAFFRNEGNEFYVAEDGEGNMAGYVWLGVSQKPFSGLGMGWVYDIAVLPEFRGQGLGEALMKHAMKRSSERGFSEIGLMVSERNRVALSLYEKLGFRTDHRLMSRAE